MTLKTLIGLRTFNWRRLVHTCELRARLICSDARTNVGVYKSERSYSLAVESLSASRSWLSVVILIEAVFPHFLSRRLRLYKTLHFHISSFFTVPPLLTGSKECPVYPGDTTCASYTHLHAILRSFQNGGCIIVGIK